MQNWAYLAFELMHKVSLFLQTTGKRYLVLLVAIPKYLKYKFVAKEKLSKKINSKQFPTLVKVYLLTALLSSRSKSMVLDDYGTIQ